MRPSLLQLRLCCHDTSGAHCGAVVCYMIGETIQLLQGDLRPKIHRAELGLAPKVALWHNERSALTSFIAWTLLVNDEESAFQVAG